MGTNECKVASCKSTLYELLSNEMLMLQAKRLQHANQGVAIWGPVSCELLDNELLVASQRVANFDPTNCKVQANKLWVASQQVASVPHCQPACWKRKGQRVTNLQISQLQVNDSRWLVYLTIFCKSILDVSSNSCSIFSPQLTNATTLDIYIEIRASL